MTSIVCVKDVAEARKYAKLNPNYIAIEPPEPYWFRKSSIN